MDIDLAEFFDSWPFDPERPANNCRLATGRDGRRILLVREPLGLQQMEYDGRPDGMRPMGCTTWLEHYEQRATREPGFEVGGEEAANLMQEGILFYQRYLVLFQLGDWDGVVRDTERNMRYFEFLRAHAADRDHSLAVEQYRPYVIRMNAVARARKLEGAGKAEQAIALLRNARKVLRALDPVPTAIFKMELSRSLEQIDEAIKDLIEATTGGAPREPATEAEPDATEVRPEARPAPARTPEERLEALRRRQAQAIAAEDFALAARLRDEIRELQER